MATAGLAVSLLTQSVWEVVISGTQRQCDIETWKKQEVIDKPTVKKKKRDKSANQSIFYICSVLQYQYFPSVSWESACVTPTPTPQGLRSQMSHSPEPLSILVMRCVGDTHKHSNTHTQTSCMSFSELCHWILGTVGACQVAVIRPTELHCCLWWHHQTQSLI